MLKKELEAYLEGSKSDNNEGLYPVGLNKVTVKGVKKGNAELVMAHVKKGEGIESATQIYISSFYVDENNMLTLITEEEGMFLIQ